MAARPARRRASPKCRGYVRRGPGRRSATRAFLNASSPYSCARWRRLRAAQLALHPLCRMCRDEKHITPATICDHVVPHRGDEALMFDPLNLQSLCKHHHDSRKQMLENPKRIDPHASWSQASPTSHPRETGDTGRDAKTPDALDKEACALSKTQFPSYK